jgi:NAD(P)H-dependent flavin oxidoreductase YrpB (nitropropane dioxygenase family)
VWIGTRFLASEEVAIHPEDQQRLLAATENDTTHLDDLFDIGWPNAAHRVLRNSTVANWEAAGRPPSGTRPGEGEVIATAKSVGEIVQYSSGTPRPDAVSDIEALSMWAGQGVAMVHKVQPAAEIVREINEGARAILRRLAE